MLIAAALIAGFVLGGGGLDIIDLDPRSLIVHDVSLAALVVILVRDGLEVEEEMLRDAWHLPARKLILAMPITAGLVALVTHALTDLDWTTSLLLGALLSPTDPVLSSSVVTNPRVPRVVRHSLNLESGLNDGLALPAVLALSAAARVGAGDEVTVWSVLSSSWLVAVFVAAIAAGVRWPHLAGRFPESLVMLAKAAVFGVFGAVLTFQALFADGWAAVGIVAATLLVARPVALALALAGTHVPVHWKLFMAWFGPKGVATLTFALLVLSEHVPAADSLFGIAALAVVVSVLAHGASDRPGVNWIARRES